MVRAYIRSCLSVSSLCAVFSYEEFMPEDGSTHLTFVQSVREVFDISDVHRHVFRNIQVSCKSTTPV